ncbi:Saccharopine dehydrogenase, NADP binding domain,NAD(P)-binding domain,Saccharopine dehydrogenase, C- [Cinara cedri]|uniref:Saccharopine dehydrogenase, NADP binding domain,NAD(P)-binding domain,Saccharopine dehydrogenase, C n=1 Tax=Cinara cedri TaxID=506608 RepID=A0A5E4NKJ5_9HEMI|nr:Saccharopine dehydrogenase, NADP binding domain,NAD(P)-binding domain,Saccharopine dehydrogenase, C- [Cinara cedri]
MLKNYKFYSGSFTLARKKHTGKVIAIRREDQSVWERRAPLAPANVAELTKNGVKVIVQPANRRAYPVQAYVNAGAVIQEDISEASVVFGVKQVPIDLLLPNKTYCMFSHTIKAQEANMPLLDAILEKNIRLIDYEKLMDSSGQRVVAFGKYAGIAGIINILHGLGLRLLALGHHTPLMHIGPAHNYRNSMMARQALRDAGYEIALGMMPKSIGPITFVFTGSGNVSQGAQEIFQELPHEYVPPSMLQKVAEHGASTKFYACVVTRKDYLERTEDGDYNQEEYEQYPSKYKSTFNKKIAPYASVIINGIYWARDCPKLLTVPDAKSLLTPSQLPWIPISEGAPGLPHRLLGICDISADPGGSIEFMNECTTIDNPFCLYDAHLHKDTNSFRGSGVLVCSIDNMPTQLPMESTDLFGNLVLSYAMNILQSDATKPLEEHTFSPAVLGAIIASNGSLTERFEYIKELRLANRLSSFESSSADHPGKRVLVLGSGHVCAPLIEYLLKNDSLMIVLGSVDMSEANNLAARFNRVQPTQINVLEENCLRELVGQSDLVVSLLPSQFHHLVAEQCIELKKNMVTASYCSDQMLQLHDRAVEAGITIVNEVGLDPGIDHLLAMECIDQIHAEGGKIDSFVSYCGGLPAPEYSNNPLGYKFSWFPRGALVNTVAEAKYLQNHKIVDIPAGGEIMNNTTKLDFFPGFSFEGFPNRDSTQYAKLYGIAAEVKTMLRGTIRYRGFCDMMKILQKLRLIESKDHAALHPNGPDITWRQLISMLLEINNTDIFYENLLSKVADRIGQSFLDKVVDLGLLTEEPVLKLGSPLDTFSQFIASKLSLSKSERDLVVLYHDIGVSWPGDRYEKKLVTLVSYGETNGYTAMARTVGIPAAIAANMVLQGEIQAKGMVLPFTPDIYRPMLTRLRLEGISAQTTNVHL